MLNTRYYTTGVMVLSIVVTTLVLGQFAKLIQHLLTVQYDWKFEFFMVLGQLAFQLPFIYKQSFDKILEYWMNMLLVSLFGSLLLLPLLAVNHFYPLNATANLLCFAGIVLFMFMEHKRRVEKLELPKYISYTWVLYRLIILIFILL